MNGRVVLITVLVILLVVGVVAGVAYAYSVGQAQGWAWGLAQGAGQSDKAPAPATGVPPYPYFGRPFFYRPFGFGFSLLGCLIPLFIFFVFFAVLRTVFWRGSWGGRWRHDMGEHGVPPMFEQWHKKAHENDPHSG